MAEERETTEAEPEDYPKEESSGEASEEENGRSGRKVAGLSLLALGIVYGDIGTSPLYALRESFHGPNAIALNEANVLGVLSLIFWSLIAVISIKYLMLVMRADNHGEGGILALLAVLRGEDDDKARVSKLVIWLALFGAALLYGDMMITPAISVLSAIEGLEVAAPELEHWVIPATVAVLVLLFVFQRQGTEMVGSLFGPIMLLWFTTLAVLGLLQVIEHPGVLRALWPGHAVEFFLANGLAGYVVLGAVFLVVTGGEALYADMGHFGRWPIRLAWFGLVLPALLMNYFGQGALLLHDPEAASQPFYHLAPDWGVYPLLALATVATVIASQAVISGAYSITRQAMQMGDLPRMRLMQTSEKMIGQIYIPAINWLLFAAAVGLVIGFGSSSALAAAYGVAVSSTMVITTILAFNIARLEGAPFLAALAFLVIFLVVDLAFWGANIAKVPDGGWFPLVIAAGMFIVMITWRRGSTLLKRRVASEESLDEFIDELDLEEVHRSSGTDVFLTDKWQSVPLALSHHLHQSRVLSEQVILLTVVTEDRARVPEKDRVEIVEYDKGFWRVALHYGFMQGVNLPSELAALEEEGLEIDLDDTTYYIGRRSVFPGDRKDSLPRWQEKLFAFMARNAAHPTNFFHIPPTRVVEIGVQVRL